ncbi:MAG: carboxypeptidase-like regulatory domain-containing protein, partial [Blastocatellia bacterium]
MLIRFFTVLAILSFFFAQVFSEVVGMNNLNQQDTVVKGRVFRSDTKQPIADVEVDLFDQEKLNRSPKNMTTKTNQNGEYMFQGVKPGKYAIVVSIDYENEEDLPCGKEIDRFINDGIGVTSWRDKELYQ